MMLAAAVALTLGVAALRRDLPVVARLSRGTAYAGLVLLALVLAIGPSKSASATSEPDLKRPPP